MISNRFKNWVILKNARTSVTCFFDKLNEEQLNKTVMFYDMHFTSSNPRKIASII